MHCLKQMLIHLVALACLSQHPDVTVESVGTSSHALVAITVTVLFQSEQGILLQGVFFQPHKENRLKMEWMMVTFGSGFYKQEEEKIPLMCLWVIQMVPKTLSRKIAVKTWDLDTRVGVQVWDHQLRYSEGSSRNG